MMIQNAAFIPDAIPAPAAQSGMANAAAAPGAGVFHQLLQGRQTPGKPAETPARPTSEQTPKAAPRSGKAEPKAAPASVTAKAAADSKHQARKADADRDAAEQPAQQTAAEATAGNAAQSAAAVPVQPATPEAQAGEAGAAATGTVPEVQPEPNPGLVVATAVIESKVAARGEEADSAAGTTALERLTALQQRMQPDPAPVTAPATTAGEAAMELPQQAAQQQQQQQQATAGTAGNQLGQKVESARLTPAPGQAQVVPATGAPEGAQVDQPQAPVAQGGERQQAPVLPDAAKSAVAADQAVAAAHLAAQETGAGRFVAMPVRKQAEPVTDPAATTAAVVELDAAVAQEATAVAQEATAVAQEATAVPQEAAAVPQQPASAQQAAPTQNTAVKQDATQKAQAPEAAPDNQGATVREAKPGAATAQVKMQPEQQGEAAEVAPEKGGQAEQAAQPQRKDAHQGEAVTGKQVREAVQAQQGNLAKNQAEDVAGTKSATAATAKPVSELAGVRDMSGSQGEQGQSQQKGQENQNGQMLGAALTAQATPAEAVPGETKLSGGKSPLHESILSQVREGVVTHDGKGNGQMSIRLNPGELGELKIQLRMDNNRLNVEVQADNRLVKDLLMSNLDSLREALSGKNLTMEGFNVSTGGGGFNAPLNEERGNQQQQQPPRFARGAGYGGQDAPRVNYLTAEVNSLLDVRF